MLVTHAEWGEMTYGFTVPWYSEWHVRGYFYTSGTFFPSKEPLVRGSKGPRSDLDIVVKFTLEQTMKAQRGSSVIALLFL
jgi:hypothetical protein